MNEQEEARDTLAKGIELAESKLPKLGKGGLNEQWNDWLVAHLLMREAQGLIKGLGSPTATRSKNNPRNFGPLEKIRALTDGELLALFPDTPVGLVTLENGTKRLVFPRRGDESRFVKHIP